MEICMYGTYSNNVAGYCRLHQVSLTVKQIKCKNCLQKECWHLAKNENHQYWRQRELMKQKRKARKDRFSAYVNTTNGLDQHQQ